MRTIRSPRLFPILFALMAAGFGPVRQAAFGATLHFDSVSTSAAPYYVDITTTNYLQQYGITLVNNTPGTTVKILCANSSYNNSCTGGSGAIVAPSSPNVLIQDGSNGESYTLQFSSPLSTLSFTRAGFNPGPTGLVVAKWSATAFGAQGNALGTAGEELTAYFTTTAPKVFTLNGPGITSVTFYANGQGVAAVSLPIDDLSSPDLAPVGTSAVTVVDDVTSTQSGFANGTCSTPPAVTVFPASSAFVYLYFDVTGAAVGDVASVNFYEPDGTLYASDSWQPITGTGPNGSECYYDGLSVSGAAAASYPGLWRASVFWDNSSTPLFSLTFTITSVSQTALSISPGGITNAAGTANPSAPVAPGSIVSIYGTNFVPGATTNGQSGGIPLPTTLDGVQVTMNGIAAPLFYVNSFQINALVPWELSGSSSMSVEVMAGGVASNSANMDLAVTAPGIFAITDAKGNLVTASNPAAPGEYLVIYCTGLGAVSNPPASGAGAPSSPLSETTDATTVTIGGVPAQVSYSGLTPGFAGLYQVNVQVPAGVAPGVSNRPASGASTASGPLPETARTTTGTLNGIPAKVANSGLAPFVPKDSPVDVPSPVSSVPGNCFELTLLVGGISAPSQCVPAVQTANLIFNAPALPAATVGQPYNFDFCTPAANLCGSAVQDNPSGGVPPYHFQLDTGSFPPIQLILAPNGVLSGTIANGVPPGVYSFGVCAVDSAANSACPTVQLAVKGTAPVLNVVVSPAGSGTAAPSGSTSPGTACGAGCWSYPPGTQVTLTATANSGWTFAGWSGGGCSGTGNCTVTVESGITVTANFSPQTTNVSLTGTWTGTWSRPVSGLCSSETYALTWGLTQSGSSVGGSYYSVVTAVSSTICPDSVGTTDSDTFYSGSLNGNDLELMTSGGLQFSGTVAGAVISGTGATSLGSGPFQVSKQ